MVAKTRVGWVVAWLGGLAFLGLSGGFGWAQGEPSGERVELGEGQLPDATIHRDEESGFLWFEALLVQNDATLEALLCGPTGRTHESLFLATVTPAALGEALEGLGLRSASSWAPTPRFERRGPRSGSSAAFASSRRGIRRQPPSR